MPAAWAARIGELARGEATPPEPRLAATVVLLRQQHAGGGNQGSDQRSGDQGGSDGGPQAYLLRRRATMAFAGGMYAYPGGGVDPRDSAGAGTALRWAGPGPEEWAERLGCSPETAQAVVCAAVRETFEEAGVLLAGADERSVVADVSGPEWREARAALEGHRLSFAEFLTERGLVLRSDLLGAWSRWITPEFEERRYDTYFFVAVLPDAWAQKDLFIDVAFSPDGQTLAGLERNGRIQLWDRRTGELRRTTGVTTQGRPPIWPAASTPSPSAPTAAASPGRAPTRACALRRRHGPAHSRFEGPPGAVHEAGLEPGRPDPGRRYLGHTHAGLGCPRRPSDPQGLRRTRRPGRRRRVQPRRPHHRLGQL